MTFGLKSIKAKCYGCNVIPIYRCYLLPSNAQRVRAILRFVDLNDGFEWFSRYSTHGDSILEFLDRLEEKGLKSWTK